MRICIVSQEYPPETGGGGIGTQSYLKAHGLSARGHHVEVVSASWKNPRTEYDGKALVHRIKPSDFGLDAHDQSIEWLSYSLSIAQKLSEMKANEKFDIIQFPEYVGEGFFFQTNGFEWRKAKFSVQLHGPLGMFAEHMGWPDKGSTAHQTGCFMEKSVIHHADGILASSHNTARFCAAYYDYPVEKINVIHSGIDVDRFAPRDGEPDDAFPKILFVGNFAGNKGFNLLIDTVIRMRPRYPRIKIRMAGKGSAETIASANKKIADARAEANVELMSYVPYLELPALYSWCDFFAGPSLYEPGPGNVYLEAMSSGRAVIACNTAGAPEVVLNGKTGVLIGPQDTLALERAIMQLAEDAKLRESLGSAGRQWVVENFSVDRYIDKVEQFYERLISGSSVSL